jgi:hypothetical protein
VAFWKGIRTCDVVKYEHGKIFVASLKQLKQTPWKQVTLPVWTNAEVASREINVVPYTPIGSPILDPEFHRNSFMSDIDMMPGKHPANSFMIHVSWMPPIPSTKVNQDQACRSQQLYVIGPHIYVIVFMNYISDLKSLEVLLPVPKEIPFPDFHRA